MLKVVKCLDIDTGELVDVEMKYTVAQEQRSINKHRFVKDGIAYDGWCRKCGRLVLMHDGHYQTNVDIKGNVITDCFHRNCM